WYDFFSGDSILVSNTAEAIPLEPGEFHIYTTVKLPTPEDDIISNVELIYDEVVEDFNLEQNYPNPFNPSTIISFAVSKTSNVRLTIYDVLGNEISVLVDEELSPGRYSAKFDAVNISSGVYFYRIEAGLFVVTKKMLMIK
ncbi:MAG: T9SS type A sorting domain-containing protein, partial [Bacteroidetes bacterium]|nr:T9SS type A sorting domain-containing protein [Bacteroidota bacterium]